MVGSIAISITCQMYWNCDKIAVLYKTYKTFNKAWNNFESLTIIAEYMISHSYILVQSYKCIQIL